jgi:hypothetical protein
MTMPATEKIGKKPVTDRTLHRKNGEWQAMNGSRKIHRGYRAKRKTARQAFSLCGGTIEPCK